MKRLYVAVVGCANAGKSTLTNRQAERKVAIVSPVPQTTRNATAHLIEFGGRAEWLVFDTPGVLKARTRLDEFLLNAAISQIKKAQIVILLVDSSKPFDPELEKITAALARFKNANKTVIVVYTKTDLAPQNTQESERLRREVGESLGREPGAVFAFNLVSDDLRPLTEFVNGIEQIKQFDPGEYANQSQADDLLIADLVREQIIKNTYHEVPHACAVVIEHKRYDETKRVFHVHCCIVVEKESQKAIVIGKNGSKIKAIGVAAREQLADIYDCKINLRLFCRVEKNWRDSDYLLKDFGYS